jgi:hypothetical protein
MLYITAEGIVCPLLTHLLALKYGENDLIKAMALGLRAIDDGKQFINTLFFYKYIKKILDTAIETDTEIFVSKQVMKKFNIEEWIKLI